MRKPPRIQSEFFNMRLSKPTMRAIEQLAKAENLSVSAWVRAQLEKAIRRMSNSVAP